MNIIRKYVMVVTVAVIAIGAVAFKAFENNSIETRYRYLKHDDTDIDQAASWEEIAATEPTDCDNLNQLPCVISVSGSLSDFLQTNNTLSKIMASDELKSTKSAASN